MKRENGQQGVRSRSTRRIVLANLKNRQQRAITGGTNLSGGDDETIGTLPFKRSNDFTAL